MAKRKLSSTDRSVLTPAELDDLVQSLQSLAASEAASIQQQFGGPTTRRREADPLADRVRRTLASEIVPLQESQGPGSIDQSELIREISKKALMALRVTDMRTVLTELGAIADGAAEHLATRIGQLTHWDERAIAELVLRFDRKRPGTRTITSRLFSLDEQSDRALNRQQVERTVGRYVRVGVARWFVFNAVSESDDGSIEIRGFHQGYNAKVDPLASSGTIGAIGEKTEVLIRLDGSIIVEIISANANAASGAATALQWLLTTEIADFVPNTGSDGVHVPNQMHISSEFMLDLIASRLDDAGFLQINPTVAKFGLLEGAREGNLKSPTLEAVRFEGRHLLDSIEACQHLAAFGRPIKDLAFETTFHDPAWNATTDTSVQLRIASDHVVVSTSVTGTSGLEARAHRVAVMCVADEIRDGVLRRDELDDLNRQMRAIASRTQPADEARLFLD